MTEHQEEPARPDQPTKELQPPKGFSPQQIELYSRYRDDLETMKSDGDYKNQLGLVDRILATTSPTFHPIEFVVERFNYIRGLFTRL